MLNTEKTHDLADDLFFLVMEHVNREEFIEPDPDSDGTRNTEKGRDLYYAIEDLLLKICQLNTLQWLSLVWLLLSHSLDFQRQQTKAVGRPAYQNLPQYFLVLAVWQVCLSKPPRTPDRNVGGFLFPDPKHGLKHAFQIEKTSKRSFLPCRSESQAAPWHLLLLFRQKRQASPPGNAVGPLSFLPPKKQASFFQEAAGPDPFQIEKTSKPQPSVFSWPRLLVFSPTGKTSKKQIPRVTAMQQLARGRAFPQKRQASPGQQDPGP